MQISAFWIRITRTLTLACTLTHKEKQGRMQKFMTLNLIIYALMTPLVQESIQQDGIQGHRPYRKQISTNYPLWMRRRVSRWIKEEEKEWMTGQQKMRIREERWEGGRTRERIGWKKVMLRGGRDEDCRKAVCPAAVDFCSCVL